MRGALVLFGFASFACGRSPAAVPAASSSSPAKAVTPSRPVSASVAGCRAVPSTVYGDEPVRFELDAPASGRAQLELFDQKGRSVVRSVSAVPGDWQAPELPSGDFSLVIGQGQPVCRVTVNRELSRATQPAR
jgi:hypothetical protein